MGKTEKDISQILVDYGVYNSNGISGYKLDVELNTFMNKRLLNILKEFKKVYMDREKMGKKLEEMIKICKDSLENYG